MKIIQSIQEMTEWSRHHSVGLGLVPTMGFLHEAHLALVKKSLKECQSTVVSIFTNPAQFGPKEDLDSYPKDLENDQKKLEALKTDVLFLPPPEEVYPSGYKTYIKVKDISERLCGITRPVFFEGVATVVLKLFNIVRPEFAFFGEKDWQQLEVIRTMVRDLNLDVTIKTVPLIREPDGLAMSSRNSYLSGEERRSALGLYKSLNVAKDLLDQGETSVPVLREKIRDVIAQNPFTNIEYISICDPHTFEECDQIFQKALIALAVKVGKARLIDNVIVERISCKD